MEKQIRELIDALDKKRDGLLTTYLRHLETYSKTEAAQNQEGQNCVITAGLIHDIDKHITNLHSELSRIKAMEKMREMEAIRG